MVRLAILPLVKLHGKYTHFTNMDTISDNIIKENGIIPFSLVEIWIYGERFIASAIAFPFRVDQMVCFGACDPRDANIMV